MEQDTFCSSSVTLEGATGGPSFGMEVVSMKPSVKKKKIKGFVSSSLPEEGESVGVGLEAGEDVTIMGPLVDELDEDEEDVLAIRRARKKQNKRGAQPRQHDASEYPVFIFQDSCQICLVNLLVMTRESRLVCPRCSRSYSYLNASSGTLPYGDELDVNKHVYERKKHFKNWISQYRATASPLPDNVIWIVKLRFMKLHIKSSHEVRPTPIKHILKNTGLRSFTEFAARICSRMNGVPIAAFTEEEIQMLVDLFDQSQVPFLQLKENLRTNFLNGSYVMNKFCRILGLSHFQVCFRLLKSRDVLLKQDLTWKRICGHTNWVYERSS